MDLLAVEPEALEVVAEVGGEEADAAQVGDLLVREAQRAEVVELLVDGGDQRAKVDAGRAQAELDADVDGRKLVQHELPHRELVEILLQEGTDDRIAAG